MDLPTLWFIIIAFFWTGYFILEGFDFGVGGLLFTLGRTPRTRAAMIKTIGPVWDGNEVWLIVAAGATFAAFPAWYATLFSAFYLPMLAILVTIIIRAVGLEYRNKRTDPTWQYRWDLAIAVGSIATAFSWGVVFANLIAGIAIDASGNYAAGTLDLINPYALLGGAVTTTLFLTHGAVFLALKTTGELREQAAAIATRIGLAAAVVTVTFLTWTVLTHRDTTATILSILAVVAFTVALVANHRRREGIAFTATTVTIAAAVSSLFVTLFPNVLPSSLDPRWHLTMVDTASSPYTLQIMTIVAAVITPVVLLYQGWTYWVFRKRVTADPVTE
ncbi:cytochrome bd-I ubiquinol oxidase subunit 2 apoprotein [Stackebrandtia endophytica]|uniref:Cytochrome bd-I ubiquinol oxidase subunit 2 apoprotein n=1 Tax=Stackebrandtia endophytica TaxID=1496996 RepID=A0A543APN6_9ACTN|nr:cytochrome d ubiquinol oxidase subunit II [Stackebrandtia endophytica]TQL74529.1 cytochrome bd-I ubiquinol oxidase subunit 2 apoprotein [Stackebrandtia endophytica]